MTGPTWKCNQGHNHTAYAAMLDCNAAYKPLVAALEETYAQRGRQRNVIIWYVDGRKSVIGTKFGSGDEVTSEEAVLIAQGDGRAIESIEYDDGEVIL